MGNTLSPGFHLPTGKLKAGAKGRGRSHPKPGCDSVCPGKLCLSLELSNAVMQHRQAGDKELTRGLHRKERRNNYREAQGAGRGRVLRRG